MMCPFSQSVAEPEMGTRMATSKLKLQRKPHSTAGQKPARGTDCLHAEPALYIHTHKPPCSEPHADSLKHPSQQLSSSVVTAVKLQCGPLTPCLSYGSMRAFQRSTGPSTAHRHLCNLLHHGSHRSPVIPIGKEKCQRP